MTKKKNKNDKTWGLFGELIVCSIFGAFAGLGFYFYEMSPNISFKMLLFISMFFGCVTTWFITMIITYLTAKTKILKRYNLKI